MSDCNFDSCTCEKFYDYIFGGEDGKISTIMIITDPECPDHGWIKWDDELTPFEIDFGDYPDY